MINSVYSKTELQGLDARLTLPSEDQLVLDSPGSLTHKVVYRVC